MSEKYLEMPWSMKDTIENLKETKAFLQRVVAKENKDGLGEQDAKEVAFDFDRAILALEKQIPKKPVGEYLTQCPVCWELVALKFKGENTHLKTKFCSKCGQAIDWEGVNDD